MPLQSAFPPAERQRAATHQAILDAALALLQDAPTASFSHEAVAKRAAVAARTVYRHFPAQADLTHALWTRIRDTTGTRWPRTEPEILPALLATFAQFDAHEALTRAVIESAGSTGYPAHGSAEGRAAFRDALAELLSGMPRDAAERLVATCLAIYSAPFWQMLRDRGQLSPLEAGEAGAAAMQAVLTAARVQVAATATVTTTPTTAPTTAPTGA